jgi:hypothetical protein
MCTVLWSVIHTDRIHISHSQNLHFVLFCFMNVLNVKSVILFRYWWLRILSLSELGDWLELDKFSKSKKSPIGIEVR